MPIPTIIQRIVLQGVEDIEAKLKGLGATGEKAFRQIQNAGNATAEGGRRAEEQLKNIGLHTLEHESAIGKLRESLHVLHPLLRSTGLEFGNMRALSSLAGAGLGAFAGVVTTVALLALEKLQDRAEEAKARLDALASPQERGAFKGLEGLSQKLGISPEDLAGPYGAQARANEALAAQGQGYTRPTPEQQKAGLGTLTQGLTGVDRLSNDAALKIETQLFEGIEKAGGVLSGELLKAFAHDAPATAEAFSKKIIGPLGTANAARAGISATTYLKKSIPEGGGVTLAGFEQALVGLSSDFEKAATEAPKRLDNAVGAIEASLNRLAGKLDRVGLGGAVGKYVPRAIDAFGTGVESIANEGLFSTVRNFVQSDFAKWELGVAAKGAGNAVWGLPQFAWNQGVQSGLLPGGQVDINAKIGELISVLNARVPSYSWLATGAGPGPSPAGPPTNAAAGAPAYALAPSGGFDTAVAAPGPQTPAADVRATETNTSAIAENTAEANRILDAINSKMKPAAAPGGGGTGFAAGGTISGPGTGTSDSIVMPLEVGGFVLRERVSRSIGYAEGGHVMARVSAGERYFKRAEVQKIGLPALQKLNAMSGGGAIRLPTFADGDIVDGDTKQTTTISTEELLRLNRGPQAADVTSSLDLRPHRQSQNDATRRVAEHYGAFFPETPKSRSLSASGNPLTNAELRLGVAGQPSSAGVPQGAANAPQWIGGSAGQVSVSSTVVGGAGPAVKEFEAEAVQQAVAERLGAVAAHQQAEKQVRAQEQRQKAVIQFQKQYAAYRAREHSAGDVGAARARVFGGDPGPSQHLENLIPGYGLDLRNVFQYAEGGDVNNNWNWDWQKREPETKTVSDISGKATFSYPVMPSMADGGVIDPVVSTPEMMSEPTRPPVRLAVGSVVLPKFAQGGMVDDAMGNLWRAWAPERKINPATFLSVPGIGLGSPWSQGAKDVPTVPPQEHKIGGIVLPHFEVGGSSIGLPTPARPIIVPGLGRGGMAALPMPSSPRAPAGISGHLVPPLRAYGPSPSVMAPMAIGGITMAAPAIPRLPTTKEMSAPPIALRTGGIVLPRFDMGGSVATVAPPPPSIPFPGDDAIDFSSMSSSRGVRSAPTIDPTFSGKTHVIDWRINGEPVARGRGDDALVDSLKRISVRDQSRRAGKASSWVGS